MALEILVPWDTEKFFGCLKGSGIGSNTKKNNALDCLWQKRFETVLDPHEIWLGKWKRVCFWPGFGLKQIKKTLGKSENALGWTMEGPDLVWRQKRSKYSLSEWFWKAWKVKNESIFSLKVVQNDLKMVGNSLNSIPNSSRVPYIAFTTNLLTSFRYRFTFKSLFK